MRTSFADHVHHAGLLVGAAKDTLWFSFNIEERLLGAPNMAALSMAKRWLQWCSNNARETNLQVVQQEVFEDR